MKLLKITDARPAGTLRIQLRFSDGREGDIDFAALIDSDLPPVFAILRDPQRFDRFELKYGTLHWADDLDLAPEYLYFRAFEHDPSLRQQFIEWGYLQPEPIHA